VNPQHPFLSCSFYTSLHTWCISQKWTLRKWLTAKQKKTSPSRLEWIEARKPHRPPHGHRGAWSRNWSIPTDYRILIDSEMIWLKIEQFLHSYFEAWTKSVAFLSCGSRLCAPCWHQQLSTNLAITLISWCHRNHFHVKLLFAKLPLNCCASWKSIEPWKIPISHPIILVG